jgi:hypothetical protein
LKIQGLRVPHYNVLLRQLCVTVFGPRR